MPTTEKSNLQDPLEQDDKPPFPSQKQEVPGTESQMTPGLTMVKLLTRVPVS
jgi:hypothetical protein